MHSAISIIEEHTKLSRPVNLEEIIRAFDIELDKKAELSVDIAGQIELLPSGKFKISINKNDHYFRQRFTMAHELGHYLFHKDLIGNGVIDNRLYRSTNPNIRDSQESEANRFASSLLMPLRHIRRDLYDFDNDVSKVAAKWQVSPKALKIQLGLTD